jgi:heme/copper-type cytochrome/quinol oxidase subunit 4
VFAIIAAVLFAIAFILDLIGKASGNINATTIMLLGLVCLALHFAPLGTVRSGRWRR